MRQRNRGEEHGRRLLSYLPDFLVSHARRDPASLGFPDREDANGALLFADFSGFTALAAAGAARGSIGTEEVIRVLKSGLAHIVQHALAMGGDVLKFAGDAVIVWWPDGVGATPQKSVTSAARVALSVASKLRGDQTGPLSLGLKQCVSYGNLVLARLGGLLGRWEWSIGGPVLDDTKMAIESAQVAVRENRFLVIVAPKAGLLLPNGAITVPLPNACSALAGLDDSDTLGFPEAAEKPTWKVPPRAAVKALQAFVPAAVRDALDSGLEGPESIHRTIAALMIAIPQLTQRVPVERINTAFRIVQSAIYDHFGTVNKLSVDEKGATVLAAIGMPPYGSSFPARDALLASRALRIALRAAGFESKQGIATGNVFITCVGAPTRKEYTILGDVVNLAARLMTAPRSTGSWDVLVDEQTYRQSDSSEHLESAGLLQLKGRGAEHAYAIKEGSESVEEASCMAASATICGRDDARRSFLSLVSSTPSIAAPRIAFVTGEPYGGKTTLLQAMCEDLRRLGIGWLCLFASLGPTHRYRRYEVWRQAIASLLGLSDPDQPNDAELVAARAVIQAADSTAAHMPAFAELFGSRLLPVSRRDTKMPVQSVAKMAAAVLSLVGARCNGAGFAVFIDSPEHADNGSLEVLEVLLRDESRRSMCVLTLASKEYGELTQPMSKGSRLSTLQRVVLGLDSVRFDCSPLNETEAELLMASLPGSASLQPYQRAQAMRLAGGLPGCLVHLVAHYSDGTQADPARTLPQALRGAVDRKIDALPDRLRRVLRLASVLGDQFSVRMLRRLVECAGNSSSDVAETVRAAAGSGLLLWCPDAGGGDARKIGVCRFAGGMVRRALLESLECAERPALLRALSASLAQAGHVLQSRNVAMDGFQLSAELHDWSACNDTLASMADDLDATVTKALAVQIPVEHRTVRTNIVLAISHQCLGECAEVLTVLPPQTYAAAKADCSKDDFDSLTLRVYALYSLGRLREALASLPPPHVSAPLGASTGAARVEDLRGVVLSGLAQWDDAELALKAARGLAEKCGQDEVFADAGLHLASLYYEVDRDSEALPVLKQSVAHFERTGNVEMLAFAGGLLALLYDSLGQHGRATEWARRSVDRAEQCENVENIGAALSASAWVALVEGRHGLAAAQYQQVLTMLPSDSCIDLWMDCHAGLGIIALVTGDLRGSLRSFVTTLRRAAYCETKNRVVTAKCLRGLVQLADRLQVADLRADIFALGRVLDVAFCEAPLPVGYALEDMRALLAHFRQGSPIGLPSVHATAGLLVPTRRSADRLLTDIAARLSGGMP